MGEDYRDRPEKWVPNAEVHLIPVTKQTFKERRCLGSHESTKASLCRGGSALRWSEMPYVRQRRARLFLECTSHGVVTEIWAPPLGGFESTHLRVPVPLGLPRKSPLSLTQIYGRGSYLGMRTGKLSAQPARATHR